MGKTGWVGGSFSRSRMPQIKHLKELKRQGLQVANAALGIPLGAKITIRRK